MFLVLVYPGCPGKEAVISSRSSSSNSSMQHLLIAMNFWCVFIETANVLSVLVGGKESGLIVVEH